MAKAKMNLVCNECGKRFKVSPSNADPQCPNCGSVDFDVESVSFYRPASRPVVKRNYSTGPFDFGGAFDGFSVSSDADGGL